MRDHATEPDAPSPRAPLPVLSYEKPLLYQYKSDLPPPGALAKAFWFICFWSGRALGLIYKPRPAPRLFTPPRR